MTNWKDKSWENEDKLYNQKCVISNKGSRDHPHRIGGFYSYKNNGLVEYASLNERLFYFLLELDPLTVRYYVQPVRIEIGLVKWPHVPDVLFFRQGAVPWLCQIKERPEDLTEKDKLCARACESYSQKQGWNYSVIYPKSMPKAVQKNLRFLIGCRQQRKGYTRWIPLLTTKLGELGSASVQTLTMLFQEEIDPAILRPVVYHLIAIGIFSVDLNIELNPESQLDFYDSQAQTINHFTIEGGPIEFW